MENTVTLETKCWERDWKRILCGDRLRRLAERNAFPFSEKILFINNVKNYPLVCRHAERAMQQKHITRYVIVEEHAAAALDFFSLDRESLGAGYPYSISELVSIFLCRSEFLLHYAGDCLPAGRCDWVSPAIQLMQRDRRIKVCNLTWNENYAEAKSESSGEVDDFYIGYGFSDQCYLIRAREFQAPIYNESHPDSARYPNYGGELFEKRVDAWMRNHGHLRATYKHASYIHKNAPLPLAQQLKLIGTKCFRKAKKVMARQI
jgi:hypothetical protein